MGSNCKHGRLVRFFWFRLPFCLFVEGEAKRKPESMLGVLQKEETHHVLGRRVPSGVRSSLELSLASSRESAERLVTSCSWREKRWLGCMAHVGTSVCTSAKMSWVFGVLLCHKKNKQSERRPVASKRQTHFVLDHLAYTRPRNSSSSDFAPDSVLWRVNRSGSPKSDQDPL